VFHITGSDEVEPKAAGGAERELGRLEEAIELLEARSGRKAGVLGGSGVAMTRSEFDATVRHYRPEERLEEVRALGRELDELTNRERGFDADARRLSPWAALDAVPARFREADTVAVLTGLFAEEAGFEQARAALAERCGAVEPVGRGEAGLAALVVCLRAEQVEVSQLLGGTGFEAVDLRDVESRPAEALAAIEDGRRAIATRRGEIEARLGELVRELPSLKAVADSVLNARGRAETAAGLERTETVVLLSGWVRERELADLERLVEETGAAALARQASEPDEEPPVSLINRKLFRPFELVLDLYSMPRPEEADPTPWLAPFFVVFFGFCLTDAGYGIALVVLAALLMKRMGAGNKLLGMLLIGGLFTIVAGALVGGWFGDLPDKLGFQPLLGFRDRLMWFNPLEDPMPFFLLSLGMGYTHLMFGMSFEIVDELRRRRVGSALFGQLPWFLGLNGLAALVILGGRIPGWTANLLLVAVLASVAAIIAFSQRERVTMPGQVLWFALIGLALVAFAARLGGLPDSFRPVKWAALAAFGGLYAQYLYALARDRGRGAVPWVLAGAGLAALGAYLGGLLPWFVPALVGPVFFLSVPAGRRVAGKLAWGGYALYGMTSYVGVVLSYIRIMALGMVTGGIAMAINTVAWMVTGIPVLGIVLALVALVLGHAYNLAVNVLGAFVHTLRLNYVEFFPRFYTGGGEPFRPFREENRYVTVK